MTKLSHIIYFAKLLVAAGLLFFGLTAVMSTVFAVSKDDITYPVQELESCVNEQECRAYCDDIGNMNQCLTFAQNHNLLTDREISQARKFEKVGITAGPGGCRGKIQCESYCENIANIDECLLFAQEHDILDIHELSEARKVAAALRQGAKLPGGCTNKVQCELYCEDADHITECLDFAEAAGFIPPEELQEARRIAPFMARGEMPGGCRSKIQCETYCSQDGHANECAEFFEKAGFITHDQAEMFRKTGGRGPGGCQGQGSCEEFCNMPENQQECFDFAKQHDLIPQDEIHNIQEGLHRFKEGFRSAPPEVALCLRDTIGKDVLSKIEAGTFLPNQKVGDHMRLCFEKFMTREQDSFNKDYGDELQQDFDKRDATKIPLEAKNCVERVLGNISGPPTDEQEQRIRKECFSQGFEEFGDDTRFQDTPDHTEGFNTEFDQRQLDEFDRQYKEEFQRQFDEQYQDEFNGELDQRTGDGSYVPEQFDESLYEPSVPDSKIEQHEEQISDEKPHSEARVPREGFFGAVLDAMAPALKRFFPFLSI